MLTNSMGKRKIVYSYSITLGESEKTVKLNFMGTEDEHMSLDDCMGVEIPEVVDRYISEKYPGDYVEFFECYGEPDETQGDYYDIETEQMRRVTIMTRG